MSCKTSRGYAAGSAKLATREFDICEFESHHPSPTINANGAIYIEGIAVRAVGGILIILVGLAWEFSAKLHTFVSQVNIQKWQAWLTATGDAPGGIVDEQSCARRRRGLPLVAQAQQPATPVIGYLSLRSREVGFLKGATHGVSQHASAIRSRSIAASPARGRLSGRPSSLQIRARGAWRLGRAPRRLDRRRRGRRLAGQRPTPFPAG